MLHIKIFDTYSLELRTTIVIASIILNMLVQSQKIPEYNQELHDYEYKIYPNHLNSNKNFKLQCVIAFIHLIDD